MTTPEPWPVELRVNKDKDSLTVKFDNGESYELAAEFLRVESPSAEVQGHTPQQRQFVGGKRKVKIASLEPVGHYAVRIIFDDGHSTGLYTWRYLRQLGETGEARWNEYLGKLEAQGLSRG